MEEKVSGDDELFNQETKKASNRNCQFWLEFENKSRLHIAMIEPAEAQKELIPPIDNLDVKNNTKRAVLGTITHDSIENDGTAHQDAALASERLKSSLAGGAVTEQPKDQDTIASTSIKDPMQSIDAKTVTIDASKPEEMNVAPEAQQSQMGKSQLNFDPNYEADRGTSMTFTYKEGLVVQILPNGNVQQSIVQNDKLKGKKTSVLANDTADEINEVQRVVTR